MQKQAQFTIRKATLSSYIKKKARMIRAFCIFSQYRTTLVSRWHTRASAGGCAVLPLGNTAQRLCQRHAVRFFVSLYRFLAEILPYSKRKMCKMAENMQVDLVQSRQAVFVRCCLYALMPVLTMIRLCTASYMRCAMSVSFIV